MPASSGRQIKFSDVTKVTERERAGRVVAELEDVGHDSVVSPLVSLRETRPRPRPGPACRGGCPAARAASWPRTGPGQPAKGPAHRATSRCAGPPLIRLAAHGGRRRQGLEGRDRCADDDHACRRQQAADHISPTLAHQRPDRSARGTPDLVPNGAICAAAVRQATVRQRCRTGVIRSLARAPGSHVLYLAVCFSSRRVTTDVALATDGWQMGDVTCLHQPFCQIGRSH